MLPSLISARELARRLSVGRQTIYNWCCQRKIPFVKVGAALRFDPDEIEKHVRHISPKETPEAKS